MLFQTNYTDFSYTYESSSKVCVTVPNQALTPHQIVDRFVKALPIQQTSEPTGQVNDDIDNPSPFQGGEYDVFDAMDYARENAQK